MIPDGETSTTPFISLDAVRFILLKNYIQVLESITSEFYLSSEGVSMLKLDRFSIEFPFKLEAK